MLWLFVGPMGFTCWISFAPVFSFIYESPESPRIVFLFYSGGGGGIREVSLFFFSNRDVLRVSPNSDTMSLRLFGESAQFGWNRPRIQYD